MSVQLKKARLPLNIKIKKTVTFHIDFKYLPTPIFKTGHVNSIITELEKNILKGLTIRYRLFI